jgi:UDP-N-acetyl-D-galactosamine dehydrogenase
MSGLPLAVEFGKRAPVIGFDINPKRVAELQSGEDHTLECSRSELKEASQLRYSCQPADLQAGTGLHRDGADSRWTRPTAPT